MQDLVTEFHTVMGQPVGTTPKPIPADRAALRLELITEELQELSFAMNEDNLTAVADAIGDLLYVVYGTAVEYGINMTPIVNEIHRSNMAKLQPDGTVKYREDGKVLKPDNWTEPDIETELIKQGAY